MEIWNLLIFLPLVCTCVAQEYTIFHQQSNWDPQRFTHNVFESTSEEFPAAPKPETTNLFEPSTTQDKPEEVEEKIDDHCTLYKARLTQKELYFQYIRYKTEIPDLKEFTLCIWMRSENLSNDHTILSYAVDGQPREIRSWLSNSDRASYFNLAVGGSDGKGGGKSVHLFNINYPFRRRRWYHTCQSWSGLTGNWLVYVEGERIGAGNSPETIGRVIRGGGVAVTGQTQSQTGGGFSEEGGFEGEVSLFKLLPKAFSRPLKTADLEGARMYQTSCDGLCKTTPRPATTRGHFKTPVSRLTSQAREILSLPTDTPIRVAEMPQGASQVQGTYFVKEEGSVGSPSTAPTSFSTQFSNSLRREVLFQTTPVAGGGVQLFYKAGGGRVSRSLDHLLLDLVPGPVRLPENSFVYPPKQFLLPDAFVPELDFANRYNHFGSLELSQGALQQQLNRQLLSEVKPPCLHGESTGDDGKDSQAAGIHRPAPARSTINHVMLAKGNGESRVSQLVVRKTEAARLYPAAREGIGRLADQPVLVTDITPVIDWRMTPKKLYAGSMWLRANPVCRKF